MLFSLSYEHLHSSSVIPYPYGGATNPTHTTTQPPLRNTQVQLYIVYGVSSTGCITYNVENAQLIKT